MPVGKLKENKIFLLNPKPHKPDGKAVHFLAEFTIRKSGSIVYKGFFSRVEISCFIKHVSPGKSEPPPVFDISLCIFFFIRLKSLYWHYPPPKSALLISGLVISIL